MGRPSFTVVIPVYNAGEFLRSAVKDVLQQSYTDFELIAVDDGSDDGSLEILQEMLGKRENCHVITQHHRGGGIARNTGLSYAKGDYVLFLDADDRFEKNLLQVVAQEVLEKQSDILIFAADKFRYGTQNILPINSLLRPYILSDESIGGKVLTEADCRKKILQFTGTTVWNKAFRRTFIVENAISFQDNKVTDTLFFTLLALCSAKIISYTEKVLVHYRAGNPTGQVATQYKHPLSAYHALVAARNEMVERGIFKVYEDTFMRFAAENCVTRFEDVTSYAAKKELYDLLHDSGICELELNKNNVEMVEFSDKIQSIMQYPYEEYLHVRQEKMLSFGLISKIMYILPALNIHSGAKIVLYGCGNVGKSYYTQIMNMRIYRISLWVDRDYATAMFPVVGPEQIFSVDYDIILLAIEQEKVVDEVRKFLIQNGVSDEKIFWQQPVLI